MSNQVISASTLVRNGSADFAFYAAQDSNKVAFSKPDEKIVIVVRNENDSVAVNTATITIAPGGYWQKDLGTLTVEVADANSMVEIGPLDSARFKNTAGYITIGVAVTQSGTVGSVKVGVMNQP